MIRQDRFLIGRTSYAVDPGSLAVVQDNSAYCTARAVWFRRRYGVTAACIGKLWDYQDPAPADMESFLRRHDDGRYGGECEGRWDGHRYWGAQEPEVMLSHLTVLKPMLKAYPAIPPGFDGWWRFW